MMNGLAPVTISSTAVSGETQVAGNSKRRYFAVYCDVDAIVEIDGANFTLPAGVAYAPLPPPINPVKVTATSGIIMEG